MKHFNNVNLVVLMGVGHFGSGTFRTQIFRAGRFGLEHFVLVFLK